jgi:hypothetical protein
MKIKNNLSKFIFLLFLIFISGCQTKEKIVYIDHNTTIIQQVPYEVEKIVYVNNTIYINQTVKDKDCDRQLAIYFNKLGKCEDKYANCVINNKTDIETDLNIQLRQCNNTINKFNNMIDKIIEMR